MLNFWPARIASFFCNGHAAGVVGGYRIMTHRNNFQFIRFGLALMVLFSHSYQIIDGDTHREPLARLYGYTLGHIAVCGFFILSGFLIAKSWDRQPYIGRFVVRSVARIYPAFLVCAFACVFIVGPLGSADFHSYFHSFDSSNLFRLLILRWPSTPPTFIGVPYETLNGSAWSIPYEFRCYILVILLAITGILSKKMWITVLFSCVCVISLINIPNPPAKSPLFALIGEPTLMLRMGAVFLAGVGFYSYRKLILYRASYVVVATACLVGGGGLLQANPEPVIAVAGGYLLLGFGQMNIVALRAINSWPDFSYGLYLYGWPLQKVLLWYFPTLQPIPLFLIIIIPASIFGLLSWFCVERYFLPRVSTDSNSSQEDSLLGISTKV